MRKTIHKLFLICDFEKEEKWLNKMAASGLVLVAVSTCTYIFEDCNAGEYNVRLELMDYLPSTAEGQQYIKFIEETGAEYVGSITRWVYFRKRTDCGEFALHSDLDSRIKHLNRIAMPIGICSAVNLFIGVISTFLFWGNITPPLLWVGSINISIGLLLILVWLGLFLKKRKLQKERQLFE